MSVGEERLRLGADRKLIFENFCNGVSKDALAEEFCRSREEIEREIAFVAKKICEYRHRRCLQPAGVKVVNGRRVGGTVAPELGVLPPIACETEAEIILNRRGLLWTLKYIGPETLSTELLIPTLARHAIENIKHLKEAARGVRGKVREVKV